MTDCTNVEVRDLLPDLLSGALTAAEAAHVQQHLDRCDDCRAEMQLLRTVRNLRRVDYEPDVDAIVVRLPRYATTSARRPGSAIFAFGSWRAAAAIATIALGGLSMYLARGGVVTSDNTLSDSARLVQAAESSLLNDSSTHPSTVAEPAPRVAVSFGGLSDYTDEEVNRVIDRLDKWDGSTSTEPLPALPIVAGRGGDSR